MMSVHWGVGQTSERSSDAITVDLEGNSGELMGRDTGEMPPLVLREML